MSIDQKTIAKIASLARIKIPAEEQASMAKDLTAILNWVDQLNEVDTSGVEPLSSVNDSHLRMRADIVDDGNKAQEILSNAPAKTAGFFTVPKVVE